MIKIFTGTLFHVNDLNKAKVEVELFNKAKYSEDAELINTVKYTGLTSWDIVTGDDATALEAETDGSCIDDNHEYLVLHFEDGTQATFRNSNVAMFIF